MNQQYFVRYTSNPQADLERGYSFVGYALFSTREIALETLAENLGKFDAENFDLTTWAEDYDYLVSQDNTTGKWGTRRSGLCGYGPFESVEAAREAMAAGETSGTVSGGAGAIFEGIETYDRLMDGQDEGVSFKPVAIVETF